MTSASRKASPHPAVLAALSSAVLLVGAFVLFELCQGLFFRGGRSYEFCHYAEIASNILAGRGFTTRTFYPTQLASLKAAGQAVGATGPVVDRFPLFAYWTALWMRLVGVNDFAVTAATGAAHALWVVVLFWLARELFNERVAWASALLWAVHPLMLAGFDLNGYTDVLFGPLAGASMLLWWRASRREGPSDALAAAAGALGAAAMLTRPNFVLWLPFFAALPVVAKAKKPARLLAAFAGAFALLYGGWALLHLHDHGAVLPPVFWQNLAGGVLVRDLPYMEYRTYGPRDFASLRALKLLLYKGFFGMNVFLKDLPAQWLLFSLFPFALMGALWLDERARSFARWAAALLLLQALAFSFLRVENLGLVFAAPAGWQTPLTGRYYLWFAPLVIVYAVGFFESRWSSKAWRRGAWVVLAITLQFWGQCYFFRWRWQPRSRPPLSDSVAFAYLSRYTPDDAWIVTNEPTQVAWYAGRRTINIPNRPDELPALTADWPADYLFLAPGEVGELDNYPAWAALMASGGPGKPPAELAKLGYRFEAAFPDGVLFRRANGGADRRSAAGS